MRGVGPKKSRFFETQKAMLFVVFETTSTLKSYQRNIVKQYYKCEG